MAAGNCVVLKPAEQTPASILVLLELIEGILPSGVINVVNGFGIEAFSLETTMGVRFIVESRMFTENELKDLEPV